MIDHVWRAPDSIPRGMTSAEYRAILNRNNSENPPCERFFNGLCGESPCQKPNESGVLDLNFGHRQADSLGGSMDAHNMWLECQSKNMEQQAIPDERYLGHSVFDEPFDYTKLLIGQSATIVTLDAAAHAGLFTTKKDATRSAVLTTVAGTGIGKFLAQLAMLHRVCQHVNDSEIEYKKRPTRVLWFAPERALATALCNEAKTEPVKYGLRESPIPCFDAGEGGFNKNKPPPQSGIVFACPHFFWDVDKRNKSASDIIEILSHYDTIVWDECDFADGRLKEVVEYAPSAFKFGITATPFFRDGKMKRHLAIGPVVPYRVGNEQDRTLKNFPAEITSEEKDGEEVFSCDLKIIDPSILSSHEVDVAGVVTHREGGSDSSSSFTATMGAINQATDWLDRKERDMRKASPDDWYSPHLIIRASSVALAESLYTQLDSHIKDHKKQWIGDGWGVVLNHGTLKKLTDGEGKSISQDKCDKKLGDAFNHSFFRAKQHLNGRADDRCKRILIIVDQGLRGMNNWPILAAVDATDDTSAVVLSQFLLSGRIGRWPHDRREWVADEKLKAFATPAIFLPKSQDSEKRDAINEAALCMFRLVEMVEDAKIISWLDLANGDRQASNDDDDEKDSLTFMDEIQIESDITAAARTLDVEIGDVPRDIISEIIDSIPAISSPIKIEKAFAHSDEFVEHPTIRRERGAKTRGKPPISVVTYEKPKEPEEFSDDEMARHIAKENNITRDKALDEWGQTKNMSVGMMLRKQHSDNLHKYYVCSPPAIVPWNTDGSGDEKRSGIIQKKTGAILSEFNRRPGILKSGIGFGQINSVCIAIAGEIFGFEDGEKFENSSRVSTVAHQYAFMSLSVSRRFKESVIDEMISRGYIRIGGEYGGA